MDSVDVGALIDRFAIITNMSIADKDRLSTVFFNLEDDGASALLIIVPLLLAYTDIDGIYGSISERLISANISGNRLKIVLNTPIQIDSVDVGGTGGIGLLRAL